MSDGTSQPHRYLIALGSNVRHAQYGSPRAVLRQAVGALGDIGTIVAVSRTIDSAPIGPSKRRYANGAAIVASECEPPALLRTLKNIERRFGHRRGGRWQARTLDLDIILWSGGMFASPALSIPHAEFRHRSFVLGPAAAIAPDWRDPIGGLSLRRLNARLTKPRPAPS
ncbi:MAG: 2-amino-4-hydroxy-6-hydroxymethyldihydropteridine diphosphokinase [Pontixanthobacter sp.]